MNMFYHTYITEIQYKINRRPRKKMEFNSPKNLVFNLVA